MSFSEFYKKQQFQTNIFSLFLNPFFIIRNSLYKSIKKNASRLNGKMLDFGCGSKPYKNLFINIAEYIGLDVENEGHSHKNEDVDIFYNGKNIPFENEYFDSLFSSEVLEHIFDIDESLNEIYRVLKKDALALFTVPFAWNEHEIPNDFGRYTSFGIKHIFEKHNFEIIEYNKTSHFAAVIAQYWILYIFELLAPKNKYLKIVFNILIISPFTILGIILSFILPKNKSLFFNNVILVKKA
ncbi:MAG: class I SAM-dependent methyltransferase [Bacteroidales bacterium]|nr:class I SAM-dependent methyltransferase [Bacteroidales bacterium]